MTQNPLFAEPRRKIVLAGATGFIGSELQARYAKKGYDVRMISRRPGHISWDDPAAYRPPRRRMYSSVIASI